MENGMRACVHVVALFCLSGCGISTSSVGFHVCGDVDVPTEVDALRLTIHDEKLMEVRSLVVELVKSYTMTLSRDSVPSTVDAGMADAGIKTDAGLRDAGNRPDAGLQDAGGGG